MTTTPPIADRLLDAQVAWVVGELTGERLVAVVERDVDELLDTADDVRVGDLLAHEDVVGVVELLLARVPASVVVTRMAAATSDQVHAGPTEPVVPSDLVARAQVEELVDASLALRPLVAGALDRLTESPLVGQLATRFISRLVVDVLEANRTMTSKVPGLGSLVSLGTNAATRMVGAADKQVQALLDSDTGGKGAAIAVRRINSVVMATLEDPSFRDAVLEAWDTYADDPIGGIDESVAQDDVRRVVAALQGLAAAGVTAPPTTAFVHAWVATFLELHGGDSVATLLAELGLGRDDVLALAMTVAPPLVAAALADGRLEQAVRSRLEPFFRSDEVAAILDGD